MHILSFDIEEWWGYNHYSIGNRAEYLPRLNHYLERILEFLESKRIRATFFCLGWVAEKHPEVIRKIVSARHEVGCHSYSHTFLGNASREMVTEDTRKAIDRIEQVAGEKVLAYRAPALSVMKSNAWVLEILAENGIQYDSSIVPAVRSFGGFPGFSSNQPCRVKSGNSLIKEFPVPVITVFGRELAYSGGGYFRLFPYTIIRKAVITDGYIMTYFHIKDFDKEQKRKFSSLEGENAWIRYFKDYYGLQNNFNKFTRLLNDFDFISIDQADKIIDWNKTMIVDV